MATELDSDLIEAGMWDAYYGRPRKITGNTSTQQAYDSRYDNEMERNS